MRTRRAAAIALLVAAVLAAACGGGGDGAERGTPAAAPTPAVASPPVGGPSQGLVGLLLGGLTLGQEGVGGDLRMEPAGPDEGLLGLMPSCADIGPGWQEELSGAFRVAYGREGPAPVAMRACMHEGEDDLYFVGMAVLQAGGRAAGLLPRDEREMAQQMGEVAALGITVTRLERVQVGDGGYRLTVRLRQGEGTPAPEWQLDVVMAARGGYGFGASAFSLSGKSAPVDALAVARMMDERMRTAR